MQKFNVGDLIFPNVDSNYIYTITNAQNECVCVVTRTMDWSNFDNIEVKIIADRDKTATGDIYPVEDKYFEKVSNYYVDEYPFIKPFVLVEKEIFLNKR